MLSPVQKTICLLLQFPELASEICLEQWLFSPTEEIDLLIVLLRRLQHQPKMNIGQLLEYWRDKPNFSILADLAAKEVLLNKQAVKDELVDLLQYISKQYLQQTDADLLAKAKAQGLISLSAVEKCGLQRILQEKN